jgi:uncharacterized membrane protein
VVRSLPRRRERDHGAVLAFSAMCIVFLVVMAALAVDLGQQMLRRREAQAAADAISLDLLRLVDGRSAAAITGDSSWSATLADSAARNHWSTAKLTVQLGNYTNSSSCTNNGVSSTCFAAVDNTNTTVPGPDAVQVTATDTIPYSFARIAGLSHGKVTRFGIGSKVNRALYSLGTTLVELNSGDSALLNPLMSRLLGGTGSVNLAAVSYKGLASANVTLGELAAAAGFGTVDDLLNSSMTLRNFEILSATALSNKGDTSNAALFNQLATATTTNPNITLGSFFDTSPAAPNAAQDLSVNLFQLLQGAAELSNGTTFIDMGTAVTTPSGISNVSLLSLVNTYKVISGPAFGYGQVGSSTAHTDTSQLEVDSTATFTISIPVGPLTVTGTITLPMVFTGATAHGDLSAIDCSSPDAIDVLTTLDQLTLQVTNGQLGTLKATILGVSTNVATLTAHDATAHPAPSTSVTVSDVGVGDTKSTGSSTLTLNNVLTGSNVTVAILNGAVTSGAISSAVLPVLNTVISSVSNALIPALDLLGMNMGAADVTDHSVDCGGLQLVL